MKTYQNIASCPIPPRKKGLLSFVIFFAIDEQNLYTKDSSGIVNLLIPANN